MNHLEQSLDASKFQFIAVDDEDPKVVVSFLRKHPIDSWILLDKSGEVLQRYGAQIRPTTVVIGPKGQILAVTTPDRLDREQLLRWATGLPGAVAHSLDSSRAPAKQLQRPAADLTADAGPTSTRSNEILVTASKPGEKPHTMTKGIGDFDMTAASVDYMLHFGLQIPQRRIAASADTKTRLYDFHVHYPGLRQDAIARAMGVPLKRAGIRLERHSVLTDVEVLKAYGTATAPSCAEESSKPGFAFYDPSSKALNLIRASTTQIAGALEDALNVPVVSDLEARCLLSTVVTLPIGDQKALADVLKTIGLQLQRDQREVETYTLTSSAELQR